MAQFYQDLDRPGGFDYLLTAPPDFGEPQFRGPAIDLDKPYLAFLGAAQTFGRFAHEPFPSILAERLGLGALNLGVGGAGPRHFDKPRYLKLINRAEAVVVQVMSGRSASSSLFDNSGGGRLTGSTPLADAPVRAEEFLKRAADTLSAKEFARVIEEMRADYVASFIALLQKIASPRILLWLSKRTPDYREDYANAPQGVLGDFPQLVNAAMVAEIAARCDAYVECVSSAGLPQPLWRSDRTIDGAGLRGDMLVNRYYPSPEMHRQAADLLEAPCRRFTGRARRASETASRFVVIGAERTGTNLLISLINQYEGCYCGNELFNPGQIEKGKLAWLDIDEEARARLLARRKADPVGFLDEAREIAHARGYAAAGFKLMYNHGLAHPAVLDALAADPSLRVIHVTRRDQLRRLVSERQARAANRWAVGRGDETPTLPKVEIEMSDLVASLARVESRQAAFQERFAGHETLNVVYEDIAARPERVAARAAEFLGLRPLTRAPIVKLRKMGAEKLADALANADALRARIRRWAAFFED
jgi:LPS sulfotransferase NodH